MNGVRVLGAEEVAALLDPGALLEELSATFAAAARGELAAPPRTELAFGGGGLLVMPGHRPGGEVIVKHVGMYDGNVARGLPHHPATIVAFDEETGLLRAVLDATYLTAARTAAAAALSVRLAARANARVAAVIGAGPVAAAHLAFLPSAREFAEIRVASRTPEAAAALAAEYAEHAADTAGSASEHAAGTAGSASEHAAGTAGSASEDAAGAAGPVARPRVRAVGTVEEAVRGADVVCLCTSATEAVLRPDWLAPGTHVSSTGYAPPGSELGAELARAGRLIVETRDAFAPPPAGCAELAGLDPDAAAELGELVLGTRIARTGDAELTVYKSMGTVIEDVAAARVVLRAAS